MSGSSTGGAGGGGAGAGGANATETAQPTPSPNLGGRVVGSAGVAAVGGLVAVFVF